MELKFLPPYSSLLPLPPPSLLPFLLPPHSSLLPLPPPSTVPPTLSPQPGSTCAALNSIASSQPLCVTNSACDEIDCSVQGYTTTMTVLPCNSPPAVRLTVFSPSGATVYSQTLSQSRQVPLLGGALTLQVTVDQLASSLGIQVSSSTSHTHSPRAQKATPTHRIQC